MHRVELKAPPCQLRHGVVSPAAVPNAPCGVESHTASHQREAGYRVPNAPCGVERSVSRLFVYNHTSGEKLTL